MPVTWVAWRMVPSTPARILYWFFHWLVAGAARAAVVASWISRGRRYSWRPLRERVHWSLAGQGRQSVRANFTTIAGLSCWRQGLQDMLAAPWGQVTFLLSQSMVNAAAVYPPARAWRELSAGSGPSRVIPCLRAASSRSPLVYPESTACPAGASPAASSASWTGSVIATSGTAACVVATWVIRFGTSARPVRGSSSAAVPQVSVRCTLYPSQLLPCFSEYRSSRSEGE